MQFRPLALSTLKPGTRYARPYFHAPNLVQAGSSALEVMTDLYYVAAETITADASLETATQKMIVRNVRSLLVIDAAEDVIGIVTSRDLMGPRAAEATLARAVELGSLKVSEVMTPGAAIEVLQVDDVLHAHVGDVVETLKNSGRQHALVVETDALSGRCVIRGVFSASQIARQLGIAGRSDDLQQTFAQIERSMRG